MDRPNILFLLTDQQRADALGCTGGWTRTPHVDALGSRSSSSVLSGRPVSIMAIKSAGKAKHTTWLTNRTVAK